MHIAHRKNFDINTLKISLIFFCCMFFIFAFLSPKHTLPWVSFYSEKYCFISFIFFMLYCFNLNIRIPRLALPLLIVALLPILQYILGVIIFFETAFLSFLYLITLFLIIVLGYTLSSSNSQGQLKPRESLFRLFSYTSILIGLLSSFIIIIQWLNFSNFQPYIIYLSSSRPFGNLAQPNQMATVLIISLLGLWYVYESESKGNKYFILISLIISFAITLTQSRTVWITFIFLVIYYTYIRHKINLKINVKYLIFILILYINNIVNLTMYSNFFNYIGFNTIQTSTLYERVSSGYSRLEIWQHMWHVILERPVIGYGWYQTQLANISLNEKFLNKQILDSSHNILIDILVWSGLLIGGCILLYTTFLLILFFLKIKSKETMIAFCMIIAVVIHSLLEYPLFYSYFLLPFGLLVGFILSDISSKYFVLRKTFFKLITIFLLVLMYFANYGYEYMYTKKIESLMKLNNEDIRTYNSVELKVNHTIEKYFFDRTNFIIIWVKFNPYTYLNDKQLSNLKNYVSASSSKQSLKKYAILLAYNNKPTEAKSILDLIYNFYDEKIEYDSLLDKKFKDDVCRFCD